MRLIQYVERSDAGESCLSLARPFTLYSAFQRIASRYLADAITTPEERWRATTQDGVALIEFVMAEAERTGVPFDEVDAFAAPGLTQADRDAVLADATRYRAKLSDPLTHARRCRLRFKTRADGTGEVNAEGLVVRNVQNAGDPNRCAYFKDWARTDTQVSRDKQGFAALSVFMPEELGHSRRCILSVTPGSNASLEGLGKRLDTAESALRVKVLGADDRKTDPATGRALISATGLRQRGPLVRRSRARLHHRGFTAIRHAANRRRDRINFPHLRPCVGRGSVEGMNALTPKGSRKQAIVSKSAQERPRAPKSATVAYLDQLLQILAFSHQVRPRAPTYHPGGRRTNNYTIVRFSKLPD